MKLQHVFVKAVPGVEKYRRQAGAAGGARWRRQMAGLAKKQRAMTVGQCVVLH
jgi:hypothetical protein